MIHFDKNQIFHLSNNKISYVMQIEEGGNLAHIYFGKKITHYSGHYRYPRLDRSFRRIQQAARIAYSRWIR